MDRALIKFQIRDLLMWSAAVALVLSQLVGEPPRVVGATLFCLISVVLLSIYLMASLSHLIRVPKRVFAERLLSPLAGRLKWLIVDAMFAVWVFTIISISNSIFELSEAHAGRLIIGGFFVGPLIGVLIWRKYLRRADG